MYYCNLVTEAAYALFYEQINSLIKKYVANFKTRIRKCSPWCNTEIIEQIMLKHGHFKQYRLSRDMIDIRQS